LLPPVEPAHYLTTIFIHRRKQGARMQFHCLIYFDPKVVFADTAEARALLAEIGPQTEKLLASGQMVMQQPLNLPQEAVTIRVRDGRISATDGPFIESKEMLGGLVLIEARDRAEAIEVAATLPHATVGHIEVRPAIDFSRPRPAL
jgi:hypothetical protein